MNLTNRIRRLENPQLRRYGRNGCGCLLIDENGNVLAYESEEQFWAVVETVDALVNDPEALAAAKRGRWPYPLDKRLRWCCIADAEWNLSPECEAFWQGVENEMAKLQAEGYLTNPGTFDEPYSA